MKLLPHQVGKTQLSSYESRVDWTICYPARHKRESWQADYIGVTHLSRPDQLFWVSLYSKDGILRLQEKNGSRHSFGCRLRLVPFGRFEGQLLIGGIALIARLQPDRHPQTGARRFRVHFVQEREPR